MFNFFIIISVMYAAMAVITIVIMYQGNQRFYTISKIVTSVGFLILAIISYCISDNPVIVGMMMGYFFCFAGDIFLALSHEIDDKLKNPQFTLGVGAFALAHLCFIWQIVKIIHFGFSFWWIIFSICLCGYTFITTRSHKFDYGNNAVPSIIYSAIVGMLGGMGIDMIIGHIFANFYEASFMVLAMGALLFMISDSILAHKFFKKTHGRWLGAGVLIFYYGAMYMMATFPVF